MTIPRQWLLPAALIAAACSGSGERGPETGGSRAAAGEAALVVETDIAALVYDPDYSVPAGFFEDERAGTGRSYTLHHVLDASGSYELCTDDYAVASSWEEADNAERSVQGYLVEAYDNDRYFEFARELAYDSDVGNVDGTTSPGFARVFKCSSTNRDGVDRSLLSGYAGTLNSRPLSADSIRVFTEYLWQFAFFPVSYSKVVDSYGGTTGSAHTHTLQLALATRQGAGRCDLIEVANWVFSVDRDSGIVEMQFTTVHRFEAKLEDGGIRICG
jgi:hypothetical protein